MRRRQGPAARDHLRDEVARVDGVGLGAMQVAHRDHAVKHLAPSHPGRLQLVRRPEGVVVAGRLGQSREKAGLRPREVGRVDLEIGLGRRLRAVCAVAVVDGVQIELQDLLLGVAPLHLLREQELTELAADGPALRFLGVDQQGGRTREHVSAP